MARATSREVRQLRAVAKSYGFKSRDVRIAHRGGEYILTFDSGEVEEAGSFERAVYILGQYSRYLKKNPSRRALKKTAAPKRHKRKTITLKNMKSVTVTRNANGTVSIKGRRK